MSAPGTKTFPQPKGKHKTFSTPALGETGSSLTSPVTVVRCCWPCYGSLKVQGFHPKKPSLRTDPASGFGHPLPHSFRFLTGLLWLPDPPMCPPSPIFCISAVKDTYLSLHACINHPGPPPCALLVW